MTLLVDTSVWSLAFRRDRPPDVPEVARLAAALSGDEDVVATGIIQLELLQGFVPSRVQEMLEERFRVMRLVEPTRDDYLAAARLGRTCRQSGVQLGVIDSLIAQLAIAHELTLLTTDRDFTHAATLIPLTLWVAPPSFSRK
ncbi:MAG TPA: PIN domain-containing protein [Nocardioides sp.]|uniref:type II toxin-antitoxin system VapC family toxin n=1 Tax=uncultured Nocardioides sp. TaxID=198441 RepID=UPI000EE21EB3|nr:PIN domain-containing protein [uncultured Nocardioides sp.]HCB04826.1 VapC toxin family PIN domain ribonuclease [Nocardioides sp.]HRD61891.1 PIN domain-containing protein [Nocardioides sp.]HRI94787.1 PIN domain-containing protein [Nocardioides sp.]HRK45157.1 PIN domain-containing protein [Nocardioides sp.]